MLNRQDDIIFALTIQTVTQLTDNRHYSEIRKILSMFKKKRVGTKKTKDCNLTKHLHNCTVIVLEEKKYHTQNAL